MKKIILGFCSLLVAVTCMASPKSTKAVEVKGTFDGISSAGNVEIEYTNTPKVKISIKAEKEDLDKVKFELKNRTLYVKTQGEQRNDIKVIINSPAVKRFEAIGNSEIEVETTVSGNLTAKSSGNAIIDFEEGANSPKVQLTADGNSNIKLERSVNCDAVNIDCSGNAIIRVPDITGNSIDIKTAGNATARALRANVSSVKAVAEGNSTVKLSGHAATVNYQTAGNSVISASEFTANGGTARSSGNSIIKAAVTGLQTTSDNNSSIVNHP